MLYSHFLFKQATLRLMTYHTHFYDKLDEFIKDYNAMIKKRVENG